MPSFNPDSIGDYVTLIVLAIIAMAGTVAPVAIPVWTKVKKIDDQVSNTHDTNLRDDIDKLADCVQKLSDSVDAGFRTTRKEFQLLHEALIIERRERIEGDLKKEVA